MSKTPISTLQEYMAVQALELPIYILTAQTAGTHLASFTYKVTCQGKSAEGTASSKKEAKHNAASEMLKMITGANFNCGVELPKPKRSVAAVLPSPTSQNNVFVNFVGKLAEHCLSFKLKPPHYTEGNICGPAHLRQFTITCTIGSFSVNGTASTKKQAKHIAAENMYQKLVTTTTSKTVNYLTSSNIMEKINLLDLKEADQSIPVEKSREKAVNLFPQLRNKDSVKVNKTHSIKDFHTILKQSVSSRERETARKQLSMDTMNKERQLMNVLRILNLEANFKVGEWNQNDYVVSCVLNSQPVIREIATGKTVYEAKERAIQNIINSIDLLLT